MRWLCLYAGLGVSACAGGPSRDGLFNNVRDDTAAVRGHAAAWDRLLGRHAPLRSVAAAIRRAGGGCGEERRGRIDCSVMVDARRPSLVTTRHVWTIALSRHADGSIRVARVGRISLGLNL